MMMRILWQFRTSLRTWDRVSDPYLSSPMASRNTVCQAAHTGHCARSRGPREQECSVSSDRGHKSPVHVRVSCIVGLTGVPMLNIWERMSAELQIDTSHERTPEAASLQSLILDISR